MKSRSIKGGSLEEIRIALDQFSSFDNQSFTPRLAIVFVSIKQDWKAISELLYLHGIDVIGATTAGEFIDGHQSSGEIAMLLLDIPKDAYSIIFEEIGDREMQTVASHLTNTALSIFKKPGIILCSTSFNQKGEFLGGDVLMESMTKEVGSRVSIYGGMAGDDITFSGSFVFTNKHSTDHGMVALVLDEDKIEMKGVAISGWKPMGISRTITKSEGNLLYTIDDRPALEMYLQYLGEDIKSAEDQVLFFNSVGVHYPFQIERDNRTPKICNPIGYDVEEQALICESEVPQGSKFWFSTPPDFDIIDTIVDSAREIKKNTSGKADALLIFSCAGRLNAMGPLAQEENEQLAEVWEAPMAGFYTYGEYGKTINGDNEFHSTTCSWVVLKEK
jgi:hypothetical protein